MPHSSLFSYVYVQCVAIFDQCWSKQNLHCCVCWCSCLSSALRTGQSAARAVDSLTCWYSVAEVPVSTSSDILVLITSFRPSNVTYISEICDVRRTYCVVLLCCYCIVIVLCYCIVVLLLYCYCVVLFIVIVLLYCNCVVIVLLLCCYCIVIVLLYCYCIVIVLSLYCYCVIVLLCCYCIVIVLLLYCSCHRLYV